MKVRNKWLVFLVAMGVAIALLAGCGKPEKAPAKAGADATADGIKIGVLSSTTGPFSISEKPILNAAKLAIDEINAAGGIKGKKLIPVYEDYASDPAKATEKIKKLILQDKVVATVGTISSATRLAVIPRSLLTRNAFFFMALTSMS